MFLLASPVHLLCLTPNGPIPTLFRQCFDKKHICFDLGPFCFSMFRHQLFLIFRYFYLFSAPKRGVQSIPRVVALLLVFFSSQTDKISRKFDDFLDFFDNFVGEPTAHGPTSSWAHEPGLRDPELAAHRPTTGPQAHELVGPRAWPTRSGAGCAPTCP